MDNIFADIQHEIQAFFTDLNWTYIFVYVAILYGVKYKAEFEWYNNIMDRNKEMAKFKIWIAGIFTGLIFCLFRYTDGISPMNSIYISSLLRSWIIVIVFNTIATGKIKEIDK